MVLGLSLAITVRRADPKALTLKADGELELHFANRADAIGRIQSATTVLPWLIVLLVKTGGHTRAVTLPRDAMGKDGHRRLRLWLKWQASAEA